MGGRAWGSARIAGAPSVSQPALGYPPELRAGGWIQSPTGATIMSNSQAKTIPSTTRQEVGQADKMPYFFGVSEGVPIDRAIFQAIVLLSYALEQYQALEPSVPLSLSEYWTIRHLLESSETLLFASSDGLNSLREGV
jgi:hypothetical protein